MKYLNTIPSLRVLSVVEGSSYLLLIGLGMPLKYMYDMPLPNKIIGYAHGLLFVLFCISLLSVGLRYKKSFGWMFIQFVASLLPFGTYVTDVKMLKSMQTKR